MQPILFKLVRRQTIRSARQVGNPRLLRGALPLPAPYLRIFGITKDSAGAALASCVCKLFQTRDDRFVDSTVSGADGSYEFRSASLSTPYYVVAYKAGGPDVTGCTANTLVGT